MTHIVETVDYKSYLIRIVYDLDATNPWEDGDAEPPVVAWHGDDGVRAHGVDLSMPDMARSIVAAHYRTMLAYLSYDPTWEGLRCFAREEWNRNDASTLDETLVAHYDEYLQHESVGDRMELLAQVYGWLQVPVLCGCVAGFAQRDYAYIMIVATKEWQELVGAPAERMPEILEAARQLYRDWAFGSVYGYQIVDEDGKDVGSCYGYFGFDHEASGLLEAARENVQYAYDERARQEAKEAPFRQRAMDHYGSADVQVFSGAPVAIVADGAWVEAQLWIPAESPGD